MTGELWLRDVTDEDVGVFFEHQRDPDARWMAAFTAKDPSDREAFLAHWGRIRANGTGMIQTIVVDGRVAGHVLCYEEAGRTEVSYWIGRDYWGRGIATRALAEFLGRVVNRPLSARVAQDNVGSRRVLEKCGFVITGRDRGFSNARGEEVEEFLLTLPAGEAPEAS